MSALQEIAVPELGIDEVEVIDILVEVGEQVSAEQGLIAVEGDKATMDIPSPAQGKVKEIRVHTGDRISTGTQFLLLEVDEEAGASQTAEMPPSVESLLSARAESSPQRRAPARGPKPPPVPAPPPADAVPGAPIFSAPSVRRLAREFGVDLTQVRGTGRKGRLLKVDVQAFVRQALARGPQTGDGLRVAAPRPVDFAKYGAIEEVALTRIQKRSGPALHRNWVTIPHVTQFDEADFTEVEAFRKEHNAKLSEKGGTKLTPLVFILKAVAAALTEFPRFNASLSEAGDSLIFRKYIHLGVAVDTPEGLVVPALRDVDQKDIFQLSTELVDLSGRAREGKLAIDELQGKCFTVSSLGGIGGTQFTPIINAPEAAILGVARASMKPIWDGQAFQPRLMLPLALSYDHRIIDGADGARFITALSKKLEEVSTLTASADGKRSI